MFAAFRRGMRLFLCDKKVYKRNNLIGYGIDYYVRLKFAGGERVWKKSVTTAN